MIMTVSRRTFFEFVNNRQKTIISFFIVFYTVGFIGMLLPYTVSLFLKLIPFALIISFITVALFHENKIDKKVILSFLSIYIIAFIVEAIGVNTSLLFGHYEYGRGLGLKLFETPLIIGVNWLFLVYTTSAVVGTFTISKISKIIVASVFMLLYDIVLEQLAAKLDMWHWKNAIIPLQNYLAWFCLAVFFHSLLAIFNVKIENKFAFVILVCQFLFFLLLFIFNTLIL